MENQSKQSLKQQRKQLANDYKQKRKQAFLASLPMPSTTFCELFDYLDRQLGERNCNLTLEITTDFLKKHDLPIEPIIAWLCEHGGGCDCEVLSNVEELFDGFGV